MKISSIERSIRRVIIATSRASSVPVRKIHLQTTIGTDIGIDGDDVAELLEDLDKKQKINWTGFDFYDYFRDEHQISTGIPKIILLLPYWALRYILKGVFPRMPTFTPERPNKCLTIIELAGTIHNGSWELRRSIPQVDAQSIQEWSARFHQRFHDRYHSKRNSRPLRLTAL